MADLVFLALLFTHIFSVVAWLGAGLFANILLVPVMAKLSPQGRSELSAFLMPRVFQYTLRAGIVALASGTLLYIYLNLPQSNPGLPLIQTGALLGLFVLIGPTIIGARATQNIQRLSMQLAQANQGPVGNPNLAPSLQLSIERLQRQARIAGATGGIIMAFVLALMVVGTNI